MSREKKSRKERMRRKRAERDARYTALLEEVRRRHARQRELAEVRKKIDEADVPEIMKTVAKFIVDPDGFAEELLYKEVMRSLSEKESKHEKGQD